MEEKQKPRAWGVQSLGKLLGWLASPVGALTGLPGLGKLPRWLAWPIRVLVAALLVFLLYMIELGLLAFFRLGNEIAFGPTAVSTSGSLTVFFSALAALIGGPLVIWRVVTAHVQAQAARRQADIAQEGQYTGLFTKAVEQLGATREVKRYVEVEVKRAVKVGGKRELVTETEPNLEVRLGAIYALERIARDSERDHWPIMEVLCAYVRNPQNCGEPTPCPDDLKPVTDEWWAWFLAIKQPRVDVQAALTVIGRRPKDRVAFEAERSLTLDLSGANLQLSNLARGRFARARLSGAYLQGAGLIEAHLEDADLSKAHLERANLNWAHLEGADLEQARLEGAGLNGAHLDGADLSKAHLERTGLNKAHLENARLDQAHLEGAYFYRAHLEGANLSEAHLEHAGLIEVHLEGASLTRAHLEGAILFGADLFKVRGLDPNNLASALGDATTKLPEGVRRPATWPDRELGWDEQEDWIRKARAGGPQI